MKLFDYFNKNVKIVDINGTIWYGCVLTYTPAIDTEDELYDEIGLDCDNSLIEFCENEIKSIEEIKE